MAKAAEKAPVELQAYNVMPNHVHLILRQWNHGAVSAYVHRLLGGIACHHRWSTGTTGMGHVFQRRFWSHVIIDERHYITAMRYVESNARHAGLVARAEDWRWGSLWERVTGTRGLLAAPVVSLPQGWVALVNEEQPAAELEGFRRAPGRRGSSRIVTPSSSAH